MGKLRWRYSKATRYWYYEDNKYGQAYIQPWHDKFYKWLAVCPGSGHRGFDVLTKAKKWVEKTATSGR